MRYMFGFIMATTAVGPVWALEGTARPVVDPTRELRNMQMVPVCAAGTPVAVSGTRFVCKQQFNPISAARAAGYSVTEAPDSVGPEWPAGIICEQNNTPVILYAHIMQTTEVGGYDFFRYRDLSGGRNYDFRPNGTFRARADIRSGCSRFSAGPSLQQICAAKLCF